MKLLLVFVLIHLAAGNYRHILNRILNDCISNSFNASWFFFLSLALPRITPEKCQQMANLVELTLNDIYGFANDTKIPESTDELAEFCTNVKATYIILMSYKKLCLEEFPEKVFNAFTRSIGNSLKGPCSF